VSGDELTAEELTELLRCDLGRVFDGSTPVHLYNLGSQWDQFRYTYALAHLTAWLMKRVAGNEAGSIISFACVDGSTGRVIETDDAPPGVPFAGRMLTCADNDDSDTAAALWLTATAETISHTLDAFFGHCYRLNARMLAGGQSS
jgi:hypothetical protein